MAPFPPALVWYYCHKLHLCKLYAHQHRFIVISLCCCPLHLIGGKKLQIKQSVILSFILTYVLTFIGALDFFVWIQVAV